MLKFKSLRQYFLVTLLTMVVVTSFFTIIENYFDAKEQVEELFDAEMAQMARVLQSLLDMKQDMDSNKNFPLTYHQRDLSQLIGDNGDRDKYGHYYEKKLTFQIWNAKNQLIMQSETATQATLPVQPPGYHTVDNTDDEWYLFTLQDQQTGTVIQVGQRAEVRSELTQEIAFQTVLPSLISIPVIAFLISALVSRASIQLENISNEVRKRDASNLDPINIPTVPDEIEPILASLNQLFERVKRQSERERRFTADAAHEMRTPLAAIKIQLQNALRKNRSYGPGGSTSNESIEKALTALERLIELVEQLLLLSRLEQFQIEQQSESVDIPETCKRVCNELAPIAESLNKRLQLTINSQLQISANSSLIFTLIRNFVDNAIRHTPQGSQVDLALDTGRLTIRDYGSGLPEGTEHKIFDRFYRVEGDIVSEGSGLGLAICHEISHLYGIKIEVANVSPGLEVSLIFTIPVEA